MDKLDIRGIPLLPMLDQRAMIDFLFSEENVKTGRLIAINAEKVVSSEQDPLLRASVMAAEYRYADGISIVKSIHKKYPEYHSLQRIAGADLWLGIMKRAAVLGTSVFLVGGQAVVLRQTFAKLQRLGVPVVGMQDGYFPATQTADLVAAIKQSGAKIVTVALGSPKQEQFIQQAYAAYPAALYMGVGGTYDVFVGQVKRAPECWQKAGLEWLYRLLKQPTRWKRQQRLLQYAYYYATNQL